MENSSKISTNFEGISCKFWRNSEITGAIWSFKKFCFLHFQKHLKKKLGFLCQDTDGWLMWICFQLQWKMRFRKGGRYRRSEVEGAPHYSNNFMHCGVEVICHSVGVEVICHSTSRRVDTDFKNVFALKN